MSWKTSLKGIHRKSPISDDGPPLLVEDRGVMKKRPISRTGIEEIKRPRQKHEWDEDSRSVKTKDPLLLDDRGVKKKLTGKCSVPDWDPSPWISTGEGEGNPYRKCLTSDKDALPARGQGG